jgi:D-alanyl-D-alanine carboxypeptidase
MSTARTSRTRRSGPVAWVLILAVSLFGLAIRPVDAATKTTKATKPGKSGKPASSAKTGKSKAAKARAKSAKRAAVTLGSLRRSKLERERIRAKRSQAAKSVKRAQASSRAAVAELSALTSKVRVTGVALEKARRSQKQATREAANARLREAKLDARLQQLRIKQRDAAMVEFTTGLGSSAESLLTSGTASESSRGSAFGSMSRRRSADVIDELNAVQEDLAIERAVAVRAEKRAREYRQSIAGRLNDFQSARSDQSAIAQRAEDLLESQLAEAESLKALDSSVSRRYQAESAALARQLQRAGAGATGRGTYKGGKFIPAPGGARLDVSSPNLGIRGTSTHGIRVAASLQQPLANLLAAALADGIYLSGGGYRDSSQQIALRRAHCGSSTYAIYQARSSSCSPPTARPGASQHERGLAIDFTQNGRALTRGSSGYRWMRANAYRYGLKNLPSEPWHWSTTGR